MNSLYYWHQIFNLQTSIHVVLMTKRSNLSIMQLYHHETSFIHHTVTSCIKLLPHNTYDSCIQL
jgi:hypothetical protein